MVLPGPHFGQARKIDMAIYTDTIYTDTGGDPETTAAAEAGDAGAQPAEICAARRRGVVCWRGAGSESPCGVREPPSPAQKSWDTSYQVFYGWGVVGNDFVTAPARARF